MSHLTLEKLGLSASVNPLTLIQQNDWFEFPGYFRTTAHCKLELYARDNEGFRVAVVTELKKNKGLSITNGIEYIAASICREYNIMPSNLILIEHYETDKILKEHWTLVRFGKITKPLKFEDPKWFDLKKMELNRLIGISEDFGWMEETGWTGTL